MNNQINDVKQNIDQNETTYAKKNEIRVNWKLALLIISVLFISVIIILFMVSLFNRPKKEADIITVANLKKIINISELNTFQAVYNGITDVMNEKKPDKPDYYVSYEAKVIAGIDLDKIEITKHDDSKTIVVMIPEVEIKDINVDITSLDFMFQNDKADQSTVIEQAYKACIEDVTKESKAESVICDLAEKNAKNIIEALIRPFIEQFDPEYELRID